MRFESLAARWTSTTATALLALLLSLPTTANMALAQSRTRLGDTGYSVVVPSGWTAVPGDGMARALLAVTAPGGALALNFNRIVIPPPGKADDAAVARLLDGMEGSFLAQPNGFQRVDDRYKTLGKVKTRIRTLVSRPNRLFVLLIFSAWGNDVLIGQLTAHETAMALAETAGACYGTLSPPSPPRKAVAKAGPPPRKAVAKAGPPPRKTVAKAGPPPRKAVAKAGPPPRKTVAKAGPPPRKTVAKAGPPPRKAVAKAGPPPRKAVAKAGPPPRQTVAKAGPPPRKTVAKAGPPPRKAVAKAGPPPRKTPPPPAPPMEEKVVTAADLPGLLDREEAMMKTLAAAHDPDGVRALAGLRAEISEALRLAGRFDEAVDYLENSVRFDPTHADRIERLGDMVDLLGLPEAPALARSYWLDALRLAPTRRRLRGKVAASAMAEGHFDEAREQFEHLSSVPAETDEPSFLSELAICYLALDAVDEGLAFLRKTAERGGPDGARMLLAAAILERAGGRKDEARRTLARVVAVPGVDPPLLAHVRELNSSWNALDTEGGEAR